ncbi:MAG: PLD nuclease N-terminal domain-containing protein [Chthoniobacteraceae bacterium]|nr:PLD nuclease N-terminal domain-containing protein [Chthoniobacteraceae bacterium]
MCALIDLLLIPFFILLFAGVGIAGTVLWIWMLIDCASNEPSEGTDKLVWILVILFTHLLGALIYLLVRRPERKRLFGR